MSQGQPSHQAPPSGPAPPARVPPAAQTAHLGLGSALFRPLLESEHPVSGVGHGRWGTIHRLPQLGAQATSPDSLEKHPERGWDPCPRPQAGDRQPSQSENLALPLSPQAFPAGVRHWLL